MDEYQKILEKYFNTDSKDDSKVVLTRILSKVEGLSKDVDSIEKSINSIEDSVHSIRIWVAIFGWIFIISIVIGVLGLLFY